MRAAARVGKVVERWATTVREVTRDHPRRCPEILGKAVLARALYDLGPASFFMAELQDRPFRTWRDHMKDSDDLWAGIHAVNWASGGFRLARDKVLATERCAAHGIAHAPIVAVVGRDTRRHPTGGLFREVASEEAVGAVLATAPDRLLVKPSGGLHGRGVLVAERTADGWRVTGAAPDGEDLSDRAFAERLLAEAPEDGLLIQPRLVNHPDVAALVHGPSLSTVRLVMALTADGPRPIASSLKLVGGRSLTDNFVGGRSGNLLAAIDIRAGRLARVHRRRPGRRIVLATTATHPVTGAQLVGVPVPLWSDVLALGSRAALAFPEIPLPSLDIAVTPDGPVFLETNTELSTAMQLVTFEGARVTLRRVWPDLLALPEAKAEAARLLAL